MSQKKPGKVTFVLFSERALCNMGCAQGNFPKALVPKRIYQAAHEIEQQLGEMSGE